LVCQRLIKEHDYSDNDEAGADVDQQGFSAVTDPHDGPHSHERTHEDGNERQDVSKRVELQPPISLWDAPALGPIVCHANSVLNCDDRCPPGRSSIGQLRPRTGPALSMNLVRKRRRHAGPFD